MYAPDQDVITYFDNIGRYINKCYRVSTRSMETADIVTVTLHMLLNNGQLQQNPMLKPGTWRNELILPDIHAKMKTLLQDYSVVFRSYRKKYITVVMEKVIKENNDVKQRITELKRSAKICLNSDCKNEYDNTLKRKCDVCGSQIVSNKTEGSQFRNTEYFSKANVDIGQVLNMNKLEAVVGEPVLANTNSYASLKQIMSELKENHNIGFGREWTFLGCDGPPYCLANRIIDENPGEYDWVCLVPGLGHLHMNQQKTPQ